MGRIGQPLFAALALAWVAFVAAAGGCSGSRASGFGDTSSSGGGADSSVSSDDSSGGFSVTDSGFGSFGGGSGGSAPSCANGMTGWKCSVDTSCSSRGSGDPSL